MTSSRIFRVVALAMAISIVTYVHNFASTGVGVKFITPSGEVSLWFPKQVTPDNGKSVVLVTGAAGFIGSHACLQLLAEGHAVVGVDNLSRGNVGAVMQLMAIAEDGRFTFSLIDLGDKAAVRVLFQTHRIQLVMHFAAIAYVGESVAEPLRYYHNVTSNTLTLLESMSEAGVAQLIYSSTCATYGGVDQSQVPVTEDTPAAPNNPYGWSKWMAEQTIRDYAKANPDLQAVILRYFNVYGSDPMGRLGEYPRPELRHHGRISNACFDAALGHIPHLVITGGNHPTPDGTCIRDYIHVVDLVDAHIAVKAHISNPPALYNVGTGKGVSVKQFVDACIRVTGAHIDVKLQVKARPGDYPEMWAIPKKIQEATGWTAKYTNVEDGLMHAWQWRRLHPNGYHTRR